MFLATPSRLLSCAPHNHKFSTKLALGVFCLLLLLDYQPSWAFPPVKQGIAQAQTDQAVNITAQTLPFQFQLPHPGYLSTRYTSFHPGVDIASGLGMPVKPIASGIVRQAGLNFWGLGLVVEVDHGQGFSSLYAHLGKVYVKEDQAVSTQDLLGEVGLTGFTSGPHTHLEVQKMGRTIDPLTILPKMRDFPLTEDLQVIPTGGVTAKLNLKKELKKSL